MSPAVMKGQPKMKKYDVYCLGNALLDMEYEVTPKFIQTHGIEKGVMTLVDMARQEKLIDALDGDSLKKVASGGSAINSVIALQHFGGKGFASIKLANDEIGQHYLRDIQAAGLDCNYNNHDPGRGRSGTCLVLVTHDADRTMNTYLGISDQLSDKELNIEALKASAYLYVEGYLVTSDSALAAMLQAKEIARQHDVKVAFTLSDPAIVQFFRPQFEQFIGDGVDLLFCNEEEAKIYTETDSCQAAAEALKNIAKQFVITLGKSGSLLYDGQNFIRIDATEVAPVDTVGAGDMYAGAFLAALTQDKSWHYAGSLASAAATKVVTRYGPRLDAAEVNEIVVTLQEEHLV